MWEHGELKVEEVSWLGVLELLRLVDLVPDVVHVLVDDGANAVEIIPSVIEVTQHEQYLLSA